MTYLTPEYVKAALHHHDEGRACDMAGFTKLELMAPDLAREYLRLKAVEKAGKALADASEQIDNIVSAAFSAGYDEWEFGASKRHGELIDRYDEMASSIKKANAAFRAVMEAE